MLIDRNRFLKLAVVIAASTMSVAACTSPADDADDQQSVDEVTGGPCKEGDIRALSQNVLPTEREAIADTCEMVSSYFEGSLYNPTVEGSMQEATLQLEDSARACGLSLAASRLQPAVEFGTYLCLQNEYAKKPKSIVGPHVHDHPLFVNEIAKCEWKTLRRVCNDAIVRSDHPAVRDLDARCTTMAASIKRKGGAGPELGFKKQCRGVLSGFQRESDRVAIEQCVNDTSNPETFEGCAANLILKPIFLTENGR